MDTYNEKEIAHVASHLVASFMTGMFIASKPGPSARTSILEYFGWGSHILTDKGNFTGKLCMIAFGFIFIFHWVCIEKSLSNPL